MVKAVLTHWHSDVIVGFEDEIRISSILWYTKRGSWLLHKLWKVFLSILVVWKHLLCFIASVTFLAFNSAAGVPNSSCYTWNQQLSIGKRLQDLELQKQVQYVTQQKQGFFLFSLFSSATCPLTMPTNVFCIIQIRFWTELSFLYFLSLTE